MKKKLNGTTNYSSRPIPDQSFFTCDDEENEQQDSGVDHTFDDLFETARGNWMTFPGINVRKTLEDFYPNYFLENSGSDTLEESIDYQTLQTGIIEGDKSAKEVFKNLFPIPYSLKHNAKYYSNSALKEIMDNYGHRILAHGVEDMKGGMSNLLMMCISQQVKVQPSFWGQFKDGPPNISPINHGPYYVIAAIDNDHANLNRPALNDMEQIIVPLQENIETLRDMLCQLKHKRLVSEQQAQTFMSKVTDYQSFLSYLDTLEPTASPSQNP